MKILGIDPGPEQSAYVVWDSETETMIQKGIVANEELLDEISVVFVSDYFDIAVVEMVACYGMPVGKSIFETCVEIGKILQACKPWSTVRVYRREVKLHFCNSARAKDSNIRQALINLYGEPGTKKNPGKLYGVKKDIWAALAVAVYYAQLKGNND